MLDVFSKELILNSEKSRILSLKEKTPVCGRGLMTTKRHDDQQTECAYHYMGLEIYFNPFSSISKKKSRLVVFIKIIMEAHNV
jgi:hypothetical protein